MTVGKDRHGRQQRGRTGTPKRTRTMLAESMRRRPIFPFPITRHLRYHSPHTIRSVACNDSGTVECRSSVVAGKHRTQCSIPGTPIHARACAAGRRNIRHCRRPRTEKRQPTPEKSSPPHVGEHRRNSSENNRIRPRAWPIISPGRGGNGPGSRDSPEEDWILTRRGLDP